MKATSIEVCFSWPIETRFASSWFDFPRACAKLPERSRASIANVRLNLRRRLRLINEKNQRASEDFGCTAGRGSGGFAPRKYWNTCKNSYRIHSTLIATTQSRLPDFVRLQAASWNNEIVVSEGVPALVSMLAMPVTSLVTEHADTRRVSTGKHQHQNTDRRTVVLSNPGHNPPGQNPPNADRHLLTGHFKHIYRVVQKVIPQF